MDKLEISSTTTVCFAKDLIIPQNKGIFPEDAEVTEAYLTIDASDCSDDSVGVSILFVPIADDGQELEGSRRFYLGDYPRDEVKKIFLKAVACL